MTEPKTLWEIKSDAHELIDEIASWGYPKRNIYKKLAIRLAVNECKAHFSTMGTWSEVIRAYNALEIIHGAYLADYNKKTGKAKKKLRHLELSKKEKALKPVTAPRSLMLESIKEAKKANAKKLKYPIVSRYFPYFLKLLP